MTETEIAIGLLALIAVLLFLCWFSLRAIGGEIGSLSSRIQTFLYDYRTLNNFDERMKLDLEIRADEELSKGLADWKDKHPENPA